MVLMDLPVSEFRRIATGCAPTPRDPSEKRSVTRNNLARLHRECPDTCLHKPSILIALNDEITEVKWDCGTNETHVVILREPGDTNRALHGLSHRRNQGEIVA